MVEIIDLKKEQMWSI